MKKRAWNYNRIIRRCPECGTTFEVPQSANHKRTTCSRKCSGIRKTRIFKESVLGRTEKECCRCHKIFPLSQFTNHRQKPDGKFPYCKKCHIKANKEYNTRNRERIRIRQRDYMRQYRIGQSGKDIRNVKNKRKYPENNKCELCHQAARLVYHHWDNSDFSKGMWICTKCHVASHWLETHCPYDFYKLKSKISS